VQAKRIPFEETLNRLYVYRPQTEVQEKERYVLRPKKSASVLLPSFFEARSFSPLLLSIENLKIGPTICLSESEILFGEMFPLWLEVAPSKNLLLALFHQPPLRWERAYLGVICKLGWNTRKEEKRSGTKFPCVSISVSSGSAGGIIWTGRREAETSTKLETLLTAENIASCLPPPKPSELNCSDAETKLECTSSVFRSSALLIRTNQTFSLLK